MSNKKKTLHCLLALVLAVSAGAAGANEIDPNWSPDLSSYAPAPSNWPLCGLSGPPGPPLCTSTAPDRMVSTYGPRNQTNVGYDFHRGIDLRTENMEHDNIDDVDANGDPICGLDCIPNSQPVFAVAAGDVHKLKFKCKDGDPDGFRITLEHGTPGARWYTRYAHLSSVSPLANHTPPACASGSDAETEYSVNGLGPVLGGDPIGMTGKSVSNNHHLHFEVRKDENWVRSAVHPVRGLPAIVDPGKLLVSLSYPSGGPFTIDVAAARLDVTRVQLQAAQCGFVGCGPYQDLDPGQQPTGYYLNPPFYDYELFNYQYTHRGGDSHWESLFCFQECPFSSVHPWVPTPPPGECLHDYSSGFHIDDATFNSVTVTPGSTLPVYMRTFEMLAASPQLGQICTRAVALTATGATFESQPVCYGPGGP